MENTEKNAVVESKETADTKENKKADEKEQSKKTASEDKKENSTENSADSEETGEEINADELFKHRPSLDLTPENAWFSKSEGGLISLKIINAEGNEEFFERVVIRRSFPITSPDEFLSVREPDSRQKGRGDEIGMIRNINIFDKDTVDILNKELAVRYFTPEIRKIQSAKEKFGYHYWEVETSAGHVSMVIRNPFSNIRILPDKRVFVLDMDGNCFLVPNYEKLDRQSYKYLEIYI